MELGSLSTTLMLLYLPINSEGEKPARFLSTLPSPRLLKYGDRPEKVMMVKGGFASTTIWIYQYLFQFINSSEGIFNTLNSISKKNELTQSNTHDQIHSALPSCPFQPLSSPVLGSGHPLLWANCLSLMEEGETPDHRLGFSLLKCILTWTILMGLQILTIDGFQ